MGKKKESKFAFTSKIADVSDDAMAKVKELIHGLTSIGESAQERLVEYANRVFNLSPAFEAAGYRINRVIVGVSVPPSIELFFSRYKELSPDELEVVRKEHGDRKLFLRILDCLTMAHKIQSRISTKDLVFADVSIELSVPPKVSLRYLNADVAKLTKSSQIEIGVD